MLYLLNYKKYQNKSKTELWNEDRKWFNFWVFGLLFCLVTLFVLNLVVIIQFSIDKTNIENRYVEIFERKELSGDAKESAYRYWIYYITDSTINSLIIFSTIFSLINSIVKIYQKKSYSVVSFWPTIFIFIQAIYAFSSLFRLLIFRISLNEDFEISWATAISFSFSFIYLLTWFIFSRNVGLIRRIFMIAERNEIMQQMMNNSQFQQNNPYASFFGAQNPNNSNQQQATQNDIQTPNNDNNNETYRRINSLTLEQLKEFAAKLSISGYENMQKEELVKIIFEIYNSQEKNNKNYDVNSSNNKDDLENEK